MNIYCGNLPFTMTEDDLRATFEPFGEVSSAKIIMDRETGRPRGFGFVEMADGDAEVAIRELNNTDVGGRMLRVNESESRPRPSGGGGGGGGRRW
jgi:RNA recognition motif-containing protein